MRCEGRGPGSTESPLGSCVACRQAGQKLPSPVGLPWQLHGQPLGPQVPAGPSPTQPGTSPGGTAPPNPPFSQPEPKRDTPSKETSFFPLLPKSPLRSTATGFGVTCSSLPQFMCTFCHFFHPSVRFSPCPGGSGPLTPSPPSTPTLLPLQIVIAAHEGHQVSLHQPVSTTSPAPQQGL